MSIEKFIADRISSSGQNKGSISKPIVKIGIIGITLAVSVMLLTVSIVLGFKKEIVGKITGLTADIVISNVNRTASSEPEPIVLSPDTLKTIRQLAAVKHVQSTAFKNGLLRTDIDNEGILLKGVDADYDFSFMSRHMVQGRLPDLRTAEASKDILVSEVLARRMNLKLNDKMLVYFIARREVYDSLLKEKVVKSEQRSRKFSICGIFKTNFADFDKELSMVDIRQIRKVSNWDSNQVGSYEIQLKEGQSLEKSQEAIEELVGYGYDVSNVTKIYSNIFAWLDKLDINGVIVVVLMILVATINMITALLILILERTNMVGLVKALGMSNPSVRKIFLYISIRLIGRGMLWGNITGIGLCLLQYYFKIARLDSETYYVDHVAIVINWYYFLVLNAGTFATCALALFLPTLIVTRLTPVKTLKFD